MARKNRKSRKNAEGEIINLPGGVRRVMLEDGGYMDYIPDDPSNKSSIKGRYEVTRGYKETKAERLERIQMASMYRPYDSSKKAKNRKSEKRDAIRNSQRDY